MPNYTLGRGKVYFSRFIAGTQTPEGYRYVGNTPEFNLTIEQETLDHFSSDAGIREKDESVPLEVTRQGTMIMDDIQAENVALFFFGSASTITQSSTPGQSDTSITAKLGKTFQIGRTASKPDGVRAISNVTVTGTGGTPSYVENTDYTIDLDRGLITFISGGTLTDDTTVEVNYDLDAKSYEQVISGSTPVEGAIMLIENNPVGENHDVFLPQTKVSPNGDFALKGDDWRQIPLNIEILKPTNSEAIYRDGFPFTP